MDITFENSENKTKCSKFFNSSCWFLIEVVLDVDIHQRTVSGADEQELATPILSLYHGTFTDRSIFSTPFLL